MSFDDNKQMVYGVDFTVQTLRMGNHKRNKTTYRKCAYIGCSEVYSPNNKRKYGMFCASHAIRYAQKLRQLRDKVRNLTKIRQKLGLTVEGS